MKFKLLGIVSIIILGAFFRFYKLDWASGLFTHPDEYHIIISANQLSFPSQMNPHFFSYGTVTIYLIYFTQQILKYFSLAFNFFLMGRLYSALFSTLTILFVYKICRFFMRVRFSLLASLLVAITPGLIQQAHFATPESALIFFLFGALYFILKFLEQNRIKFLLFTSIFFGLAMGVKINSIVFLLPLTMAIAIKSCPGKLRLKISNLYVRGNLKAFLKFITLSIASVALALATFAIAAPFVFLDSIDFKSNLDYEGGLAIGKFSVFYTRQFIDTTPIVFQAEKILPYALGIFLLLFAIGGFMLIIIILIKRPKSVIFIVSLTFLSIFLTNAFLFAKWTRFVAPSFPFFAIFSAFLLDRFYSKSKFISSVFTVVLLTGTLFWTIAFFSIYLRQDVRITSSNWIEKNLPTNSTILLEGGNMVDIPLEGNFNKTSLDFYNIETDNQQRSEIIFGLNRADYFIIQSRRVFMNHQRLPQIFPKTANFYAALFDGKLGFTKIKEFTSYPMIQLGPQSGGFKLEFPDEKAEETWSVFDHPVIRVFKKMRQLSISDYEKILELE